MNATEPMVRVVAVKCGACGRDWKTFRWPPFVLESTPFPVTVPARDLHEIGPGKCDDTNGRGCGEVAGLYATEPVR